MKDFVLHAECLASKWGFGDGDALEDYLWNELGLVKTPSRNGFLHAVSMKYLAPELERRGIKAEIELIETHHNPVRICTIDGVQVDHYHREKCPDVLKNIEVVIPKNEILAMLSDFL